MPAYRGAEKDFVLDTLDRTRRFLSKLDIGTVNNILIAQRWDHMADLGRLDYLADSDENFAELMRPVVSFLRLFKDVLRLHAFADAPAPGQETSEALDVYKNLLSFSALTPAGGILDVSPVFFSGDVDMIDLITINPAFRILQVPIPVDELPEDGEGYIKLLKEYDQQNEINRYVRARKLLLVSESDAAPDSNPQATARQHMADCVAPPEAKAWAQNSLTEIYGLTRSGLYQEVENKLVENPIANAVFMEGLDVLSGVAAKDQEADLPRSMEIYRASLGSVDMNSEGNDNPIQGRINSFLSVARPVFMLGDICINISPRSPIEVSPDFRVKAEENLIFSVDAGADPGDGPQISVFFNATAKGAQAIATGLRSPVENFDGLKFLPPPQM